jgi:parallel beta-helix repeat protein
MKKLLLIACCIYLSPNIYSEIITISPSDSSQEKIQESLILANPGDIIQLTAGVYDLEDSLSLDVDGVTVQGDGHENTILDFSGQKSGAQGLMVTSDEVILKNFAVLDSKGDAIKVKGSNGISFINVRTEWSGGPKSSNGAYGLYPVESKNVLIDGCIAIGASDAGIYVGQSENIIVRNSIAKFNVAGIEIENSFYADVYGNTAEDNTGGILVFDLPGLPQQGGHDVRVFNNSIFHNNTDNFAPEGNIVGEVPRGTGIIIMANSNVEIFDNRIEDHETVGIAVVSYINDDDSNDFSDSGYYPHPKSVQIHNNKITRSGHNPDLDKDIASILYEISDGDMPDIFWDGVLPLKQMILGQPNEEKLILKNNGEISFAVMNPIRYMLSLPYQLNRDESEYSGNITPLKPVEID